LALSSEIWSL